MAITLPLPVRVAAGLVATGIQLVRSLPEEIPAIPVALVGNAMRLSMKVQQEITTLATRGDELLGGIIGGRPQESPNWATFDEDTRSAPLKAAPPRDAKAAPARPAAPTPAAAKPAEATPTTSAPPPAPTPTGPAAETPPVEAPTVPAVEAVLHTPEATALSDTPTTATEAAAEVVDAVVEAATHAVPEPAATDDTPAPTEPAASDDTPAPAEPAADEAATPRASDDIATPANPQVPAGSAVGDGPATLPGYDNMTLAQVRGHLRELSVQDVSTLLAYEQAGDNRAPFLTLLSNRLVTLGAPES